MAELHLEWDPRKSASNARKHKVTFEEARSAFADPNGLVIDDPDHSQDEERFILLGLSDVLRLLVVCHVLRSDTVRIISARKATPRGQNLSKERMTMRKEYDFAAGRKNPMPRV